MTKQKNQRLAVRHRNSGADALGLTPMLQMFLTDLTSQLRSLSGQVTALAHRPSSQPVPTDSHNEAPDDREAEDLDDMDLTQIHD